MCVISPRHSTWKWGYWYEVFITYHKHPLSHAIPHKLFTGTTHRYWRYHFIQTYPQRDTLTQTLAHTHIDLQDSTPPFPQRISPTKVFKKKTRRCAGTRSSQSTRVVDPRLHFNPFIIRPQGDSGLNATNYTVFTALQECQCTARVTMRYVNGKTWHCVDGMNYAEGPINSILIKSPWKSFRKTPGSRLNGGICLPCFRWSWIIFFICS